LNTNRTYQRSESAYRHRIGYSIVAVQILAIVLFRYLPAVQPGEDPLIFNERIAEIDIELIEPTRQGRLVPAPPRPVMLPPEPSDVILEDEIIELAEPQAAGEGEPDSTPGPTGIFVENPGIPPSVVRIVEAITPDQIRRENIRLEVAVRFLISDEGNVEDITIERVRKQERGNADFTEIPPDEYEISEAIRRAAMQWRFRPARHEGMAVSTYSTHFFTLGG
jgi:hypothetical protein